MTSSHSPASRFSCSLPIMCAGLLFSFLSFFSSFFPVALLHESGRQILWQLQCFHLTPDGAASVYFTDQLLAKTTSSSSTQSAASPLGSLARSLRFMSSEKHFFVAFFPPLLFCCLCLTQFLKAVSFFWRQSASLWSHFIYPVTTTFHFTLALRKQPPHTLSVRWRSYRNPSLLPRWTAQCMWMSSWRHTDELLIRWCLSVHARGQSCSQWKAFFSVKVTKVKASANCRFLYVAFHIGE